jgi:hypothetical protein
MAGAVSVVGPVQRSFRDHGWGWSAYKRVRRVDRAVKQVIEVLRPDEEYLSFGAALGKPERTTHTRTSAGSSSRESGQGQRPSPRHLPSGQARGLPIERCPEREDQQPRATARSSNVPS